MRRVRLGLAALALLPLGACTSAPDDRGSPSLFTAASSVPAPVRGEPGGEEVGRVLRVTDGDTLRVELDGREEDVRLIGINAPETGECFAAEATAGLSELMDRARDDEIVLVRDVSDRDRFGRLLRYAYVGEQSVNEAMVADGLALAVRFEPDVGGAERLEAAQADAERDGRGLWAPDACGRVDADAGSVVIADLVADPPGDDTADANAEYVVVENRGAEPVDLSGWGLKDETASHRFAFPVGFSLAPGAAVTVHTGCGSPAGADLFWCNQGSAVWNNDGDTAFLLDPDGNIVDTRAY